MEGQISGYLLAAVAASLIGLELAPAHDPCNLGVVCELHVPTGQTGNPYIRWSLTSSSAQKCRCDSEHPEDGVVPCVASTTTACTFDVDLAFDIPAGKSVKYNGVCYAPGDSGPKDWNVRGGGCSTGWSIAFDVYDTIDCSGPSTTLSFTGVCTPTNQPCKPRKC
jgi:hypothetical protein